MHLDSSGDSYTQTGFNDTQSLPAPGNPLGNPPYPVSHSQMWEFPPLTLITLTGIHRCRRDELDRCRYGRVQQVAHPDVQLRLRRSHDQRVVGGAVRARRALARGPGERVFGHGGEQACIDAVDECQCAVLVLDRYQRYREQLLRNWEPLSVSAS